MILLNIATYLATYVFCLVLLLIIALILISTPKYPYNYKLVCYYQGAHACMDVCEINHNNIIVNVC